MLSIRFVLGFFLISVPYYCYGVADYAAIHEKCNSAFGISMGKKIN